MATIKRNGPFVLIAQSGEEGGPPRVSCICCCTDLELNSTGGDEGYDEEFELQKRARSYEFTVVFTAFNVPDQLTLIVNGSTIYDSECIGTQIGQPSSVTETVIMPAGAEKIRIVVNPNCAGPTSGTLWTLLLQGLCAKPVEEE